MAKLRTSLILPLTSVLSFCLASQVFALEETPKFIETRVIDSRIGELKFERGFPNPDTVEKLFNFRTFYRGVEVFNQNTFGASLYQMRKAFADAGAEKPNEVLVWKDRMDSKSLFLTGNSETVYALTFLDLKKDGPTVIEAPPKLLGLINDMWMRYVGDIGVLGPDKGKGGKFLILPPGYDGPIPDGYYVMKSKTYGVWVALRAGLEDGKTDAANERYETLKIYPLAKAKNPEPTILINATGMEIDTIHAENYSFMEELGHLVEQEHSDALPEGQKFFLASVGMEFGKPFNPDAKTKAILEEAADVGAAMLRTNMWNYTGDDKWIYEDRKWWNPFVGGKYTFDPNGYLNFDAQAFFAAYATGVTPAMVAKNIGTGSQYLCTHVDKDGNPLDGEKNYELTVPKDVPAKDFWSAIVYDAKSRSMLQTSQPMPSISSYTNPEVNADGSVDIYFGPKAPAGKEKNWIETVPDKGWTMIFRIYGPLEPFYKQTWKLNDIKLLD
jgi:hypothetical protein